jgi:hypothetical protein
VPRNINAPFNKICGKSATRAYRKISLLQSRSLNRSMVNILYKQREAMRDVLSLQLLFQAWLLYEDSLSEVGKKTFYCIVCQSQIRKFLGSFLYRKSPSFLDVPVGKSQIAKQPQKFDKFKLEHYMPYVYVCRKKEKKHVFADLRSFKAARKRGSANPKTTIITNPQITKNIVITNRKSAKCRSANLTNYLN